MDSATIQRLNALKTRFDSLKPFYSILNRSEKDEYWYVNIFVGLLMETRDAHLHLHNSLCSEDVSQGAWAVRNLLELKIWTMYVTTSRAHARRFNDDRLIDMTELIRIFTGIAKHHPEILASYGETVDLVNGKLADLFRDASVDEDEQHLNVGKISKEIGLEKEFYVLNGILSKYVHPTAALVLLPLAEAEQALNAFLAIGELYCNQILGLVHQHLASCGLPTFPNHS